MLSKKLFISLGIFAVLMIVTSIIKTQTRLIEKKIYIYEKKIANLENSLYETQLDFYYLTSPDSIVSKIQENSDQNFAHLEYSRIYFSLDQFLSNREKTTQKFTNGKEKEKFKH